MINYSIVIISIIFLTFRNHESRLEGKSVAAWLILNNQGMR